MIEFPFLRLKELINADNPAALELIYDAIGERLYRHILCILGSVQESEDVFQELFIQIAKNKQKLLNVDNPVAYLFAMARNMTKNAISKIKRHYTNLENYRQALDTMAEIQAFPREQALVMRFLLELPLKQREIVTMKCIENMTFDEIAQALGVSINTAASRYRYAMAKLRKKLVRGQNEG